MPSQNSILRSAAHRSRSRVQAAQALELTTAIFSSSSDPRWASAQPAVAVAVRRRSPSHPPPPTNSRRRPNPKPHSAIAHLLSLSRPSSISASPRRSLAIRETTRSRTARPSLARSLAHQSSRFPLFFAFPFVFNSLTCD